MVATKSRRQLFVDSSLQGALLARCVFYWGMCLAAVFVSLLCWDAIVGPSQIFSTRVEATWYRYAPALLLVAALTPVIALDCLRLSNRFAGPMIRLRRTMRDLAQGERVEPVVVRRSDFWRDFADEFNAVVLRMRKLESDLAAARDESGRSEAASASAWDERERSDANAPATAFRDHRDPVRQCGSAANADRVDATPEPGDGIGGRTGIKVAGGIGDGIRNAIGVSDAADIDDASTASVR